MYMDEKTVEYCKHDAISTAILYHSLEIEKLKQLERELNESPTGKMWTISLRPFKVKVVCEHCKQRGYVSQKCNACGGAGTHNKTQHRWVVNKLPTEVVKIDRDTKTGNLRYWTSLSDFYYESQEELSLKWYPELYNHYPNGVHFAHFNIKDAQVEVNRLNQILGERGVVVQTKE